MAGLKEALAKAGAQAQLRPVQDRIAHTEAFLDRSRKKMEALSAEASRFQEVMAELTTEIQDGTSRLEVLKAEARVEPSPFTVPTDPQEEVRLFESTDRPDGRFHGGRRAGGEESQDLCHDTSGCGADLSKWTSIEGGFRPRERRRHLALGAGPVADMQEATLAGNGHEVARMCHVMGTAATSWSTVPMTPSMVSDAVR